MAILKGMLFLTFFTTTNQTQYSYVILCVANFIAVTKLSDKKGDRNSTQTKKDIFQWKTIENISVVFF